MSPPGGHELTEPIRVLHVDDDPTVADLVATYLERESDLLTVETATGADAGLDLLTARDIDCVVSDYEMPGRDGIEFLEAVRETHPDLPFILYTGQGSEAVASEAISAGVTDYLQKESGTEQYELLANRIENAVAQSRAERKVDETERRLLELSESTHDVLWMFSRDWDELLFVNSAYEDIWGRSAEALAKDSTDFLHGVHPEDRDHVKRAMERVSSGESVDIEYRVNESEDYGRWVWVQGEPVTDEDGTVSRVCGFVRDITDRKEQRADLERKTRAMDSAPVGIVLADPDQDDNPIVYANDEFQALTGYSEADILGRNCRFLQGENTDPEPAAEMRAAIDANEPVTVELRNYRKDGTEFWNRISITPIYDDGTLLNYAGFQRDVTDRKEREEELRSERAFIEQSLNALDDVFYVFSPDGEILRWNDRLSAVTGYTDEEIEGMRPGDFFPNDHTGRVAKAVHEVLETGSAKVQADYLTKDGDRIPHEFTGLRLTGPEGETRGFVGIARDISERLAYERQLEQQNERLEEFASIVSHDLRNPLNVAQGRLELARRECDSDHLEKVASTHERMEQLIEGLLTLAAEGDIATDVQSVDLHTIVESCWQTVETHDATLVTGEHGSIRADESRLRQLLENLIRNSVEHGSTDSRTQSGDSVEHGSTNNRAEPGDSVEHSSTGDRVDSGDSFVTVEVGLLEDGFYVEDDGQGIPAAKRDRVFESGVTTNDSGLGVGLSIVKRVAQAHGWTVTLTESEAGGARFELTGVEFVE